MIRPHDERVKQVAIGAGILIGLMTVFCGLLLSWRLLPGILGEWIGTMLGIMSTPFFLEGSFLLLGLFIVISLNIWHRRKDGDELVYLEQVTGPDVPKNLPDQAKWAIYRDEPLATISPTAVELAEGACEIGDYPTATECLASLSEGELKQPAVLEIRLKLAKASGRSDLASELENEIKSRQSRPI